MASPDTLTLSLMGTKFVISKETFEKLKQLSDKSALLCKEAHKLGTKTELYLEREPTCFATLLQYCRQGELHLPRTVCPQIFQAEMAIWGVELSEMSNCCYNTMVSFLDDRLVLQRFESGFTDQKPQEVSVANTRWRSVKMNMWTLLDKPFSSRMAKIYFLMSLTFMLMSLFSMIVSTSPAFRRQLDEKEWKEALGGQYTHHFHFLQKLYGWPAPSEYPAQPHDHVPPSPADSPPPPPPPPNSPPPSSPRKKRAAHQQLYVSPSSGAMTGTLKSRQRSELKQDLRSPDKKRVFMEEQKNWEAGSSQGVDISTHNSRDQSKRPSQHRGLRMDPKRGNVSNDLRSNVKSSDAQIGRSLFEYENVDEIDNPQESPKLNDALGASRSYNNPLITDTTDVPEESAQDMTSAENSSKKIRASHTLKENNSKAPKRIKRSNPRGTPRWNPQGTSPGDTTDQSPATDQSSEPTNTSATITIFTADETNSTSSNSSDRDDTEPDNFNNIRARLAFLAYMDYASLAFFVLDLTLRFVFCPRRTRFLCNGLNVADLLAVMAGSTKILIDSLLPSAKYTVSTVDVIDCLQILRFLRFFRLLRDVIGFRVLLHSVKASTYELLLLVMFLSSGVLIFSTLVFWCERSNMGSIPEAFWWAIVTMTTVGYGDLAPETFLGKVVGSLCAISGVVLIAITIPVLVNNFLLFYGYSKVIQARQQRSRKEMQRKWEKTAPRVMTRNGSGIRRVHVQPCAVKFDNAFQNEKMKTEKF